MKLQSIIENEFDDIHKLDEDRAKIKQVIKHLSDMYYSEIKADKEIELMKMDEDLLRVMETGKVFLQRLEKLMSQKTRKTIHQKSLERDLALPPEEDGIMSSDEYFHEGKTQNDDFPDVIFKPSISYKRLKKMFKSKKGRIFLKKKLQPLDYYILSLW